MYKLRTTRQFDSWLNKLRDIKARTRIQVRLDRLDWSELGNFGDFAPVRAGISELRISYGPGYRVYFTVRSRNLVILLVGGDKGTQSRDIEHAIRLAKQLRN